MIGFNVVPDEHVRQMADSRGVDIRLYSIIYRITEDLKAAMVGTAGTGIPGKIAWPADGAEYI